MSKLYDEIKQDCSKRGLGSDDSKCIYNRFYACTEAVCPLAAKFRGMRPADMLLERSNLMDQYKQDMAQKEVDMSDYADAEGM